MAVDLNTPRRTQRLELRGLVAADEAALVAYRGRADVCQWIPEEPMTADRVRAKLAGRWSQRLLDHDGEGVLAGVVRRDTGSLVGDVSLLWASEVHRSGEIGYVFDPEAAGHGFATEAAHEVLHWAFDDLAVHRMVARVDLRNHASAALARRLGMRQEAHLVHNEWFKGGWSDELDFALLDTEFSAQHAAGAAPAGCRHGVR